MRRDHEGDRRAFYWINKSWYNTEIKPNEIMFGLYSEDGGTSGEVSMKWDSLSNKDVAQLHAYEDTWSVLSTFSDVLTELAKVDSDCIQPEDFIEILKKCGFEDITKYEAPLDMRSDKKAVELRKRLAVLEVEVSNIKNVLNEA